MYCCKNSRCGKNFGKRIIAFALALALGLLAASFLRKEISVTKIEKVEKVEKIEKVETVKPAETTGGIGESRGAGEGEGIGCANYPSRESEPDSALKVLSKPQARYTEEARENNAQGTVTLKVTFLADGKIGTISPVNELPYGLTESAIAAARQICFEPAKKNGVPYASIRTVTYSWTIY